ncbi:MAG: beta strand repeat-containing protein [Bacteroidales bacterium]
MKKILLFILSILFSTTSFSQIIADHTVVDKFNDIPQAYIDEVKKMWLVYAGESHSAAIRTGLALLESINPKFQVNITESGTPESYTDSHLRASRATWGDLTRSTGWIYGYGEEDWFTSSTAINRTKSGITYCNTHSLEIAAMGFGWCWDTEINTTDEFNMYLNATDEYVTHCTNNSYSTKVFFTTGTVDGYTGLTGYSKHLGYELIRAHVSNGNNRILFDYADILCYDDNSEVPNTTSYDGHVYPIITTTNSLPEQTGHISNAGALRLGKAMWWMLARIAGWDGGTSTVPVTGITVTGAGGASTITQNNGTLALTATVTPANATNKTVTWSIINSTGQATINSSGVVTAVSNGTVTARATANDGSGVSGQLVITISGQTIPVSGITVTGAGGASTITQNNGTLALTATVTPANATNKTVTWSIINNTGQATINSSGVVTAVSNGTITARATANDGSGVSGQLVITISGQTIPVSGITVTGAGGASTITQNNGTLALTATVTPANATNKTVTWSIINSTGQATINSSGVVTAVSNGTITARATANDGSGVSGQLVITISGQTIPVSGITVTGAGGASTITQNNGTLALTATVTPANATNKTVTWSIINSTGQATINSSGVVTAVSNGTITARATANDGSGVSGQLVITISGQGVPVSGITVTGAGGASTITQNNGTLALTATVTPANATNKTVTWSIINSTGQATINSSGVVTAVSNGTVTARATANDGSGVSGQLVITISGQGVPVSGITVTGAGGASTITQNNGTLALTATVTPANATNKTVTWSIINSTGQATINSSGVVTAVSNGTVTARATANDGSGVSGQLVITISGQTIPVSGITVTGAGGASTITQNNGTLALTATVTPANATNKTVTWSIINNTGQATINSSGVVTAVSNGTVVARATANDGSGVFGDITISITNQVIPVTGISISGGNAISTQGGSLQLSATVTPSNATDKSVVWSIVGGTGQATISQNGLVSAVSNGSVIIRATANGGSNIYATVTISVTNQTILVSSITVTASGGSAIITGLETSLQLNAAVSPANATNKNVNWSVVNGSGRATISSTGLLTPVAYGTVTAIASAVDGSGISGNIAINIVSDIISITGISVSSEKGETTINEIGGTLQLTADVTPADASDKTITWSINNGTGRATISSNGLVTAEAYGLVTAVATANDGSGISGSLQIEIDDSQDKTLLPYINGNLLKVPLKQRFTGKKIGLYDIYGRVLEADFADSDIHEFDISKFHPGIYLIVLTDDSVLEVHKVVIRR